MRLMVNTDHRDCDIVLFLQRKIGVISQEIIDALCAEFLFCARQHLFGEINEIKRRARHHLSNDLARDAGSRTEIDDGVCAIFLEVLLYVFLNVTMQFFMERDRMYNIPVVLRHRVPIVI